MSEHKNSKSRRHCSHLRRRSRSTEATDSSPVLRDAEDVQGSIEVPTSSGLSIEPRQVSLSERLSESPTDSVTQNHNNERRAEQRESCEVAVASSSRSSKLPDCAICLQPCVHPARLPCTHIFCFLCLKGIARGPHTCAMCRAPIPLDYTDNPDLVLVQQEVKEDATSEDKYTWFYEGRNGSGWWQYDTRTSTELEQCFQRGENKTEVLIAGYLYTVDLEEMVQVRKNEPARRRAIKRDVFSCSKKGIAGLRQPVLSGLNEAMSRLNIRNNSNHQN